MTPAKSALRGPWPSEIRTSWSSAQLRRVVRFRNGADYKSVEVPTGGYPVFGSGGEFRRASSYLYEGPSVLFGRKGTVDRPLLVDERFWTVDTMFYTEIGPRLDPRYLHYYATTMPFRYYATNTAVPSMTQSDLGSHVIPLPTIEEQRMIADFLDRETARIDTLIAKQEQLVVTLRERRSGAIANAVGLGSRHSADPHWFGTMPPDWRAVPCRAIFTESNDRNSDPTEDRYLSLTAARGVIPYAEKGDIGNKRPEDLTGCKLVQPGDFVLNSMNFQIGSFGVSRHEGVCSSVYVVLKPRPDGEDPEYLEFIFHVAAFQRFAQSFGNGILDHRRAIGWDVLKGLILPMPPLPEQRTIVSTLRNKTRKIDALIAKTERFVALSKERRSALITAAVTGQLDVRGEVA